MVKFANLARSTAALLAACGAVALAGCAGSPAAAAESKAGAASIAASTASSPASGPADGPPGAPPGGAGGAAPAAAALPAKSSSSHFSDLGPSTASANPYIDYLRERGILLGYDKLYYPDRALSRADLAVLLYGKYKWSSEGFGFGDVPTDAYYFQAVMRGKAAKVIADEKYFYPDRAITREEAAAWIYAAEVKFGMPPELASDDLSAFKDAGSVSASAKKAVATVARLSILTADAAGNFDPKGSISRADIAASMYRLLSLGGGGPGGSGGSGGSGGPGAPPGFGGGSQQVDHGSYASKAEADVAGATYVSTGDAENALRVEGKVTVSLRDIAIVKTAGAAGEGDASNFYGSNAGLLALDGARVSIENATVTTSAAGANGVFAYGEGTAVTLGGSIVRTAANSSGGVMVAGGGAMYVNGADIETQGGSSAPLRSDRGGGMLVVAGGRYVAHGVGSPAVYSTAQVSVSDATLIATGSEAIVVEGRNSVALADCEVTGRMVREGVENLHNVMIYQSMSGDAAAGKGSFSMSGGRLTSENGDMFYVTNTSCSIVLSGVELALSSECLLRVVGNDARTGWGVVGENGGACDFLAAGQDLTGTIVVDSISSLDLALTDGSVFEGAVDSAGRTAVRIDATSSWILSADSRISSLSGAAGRIAANGHRLYVGGEEIALD